MGQRYVIVPAAGKGLRLGGDTKKQFVKLAGVEILVRTLKALSDCPDTDRMLVVCGEEDLSLVNELVSRYELSKVEAVIPGGATRQESVWKGLCALPASCELVAVHDGVRPFVTGELLSRSFQAAAEYGACVPLCPVTDTVKVVSENGFVEATPVRSTLFAAQTPQTFRREVLDESYRRAMEAGDLTLTDDAQAAERYGSVPVKGIQGDPDNIKITVPADLPRAEQIFRNKSFGTKS